MNGGIIAGERGCCVIKYHHLSNLKGEVLTKLPKVDVDMFGQWSVVPSQVPKMKLRERESRL